MWLTRKLFQEKGLRISSGETETDSKEFSVQGENRYQSPEMLLPYGFSSAVPAGKQAVMLEGYCVGVPVLRDSGLEEGEVRLYSEGGAEILLLRSGEVVINGQVFAPKEG